MAGVNVPGSRPSILKTAVPTALSIAGSVYGGPAGGMAGAKIGQSLVSGGADPGAVQSKGGGAMQRRIETLQQPDPNAELAKAQDALKQLPPEEQAKYGPALAEAQKRAQQGGY